MAKSSNPGGPTETGQRSWVKRLDDVAYHNAPGGIRYKQLTSGTPLAKTVEVDFVPVPSGSPIARHAHAHAETLCLIVSGSGSLTLGEETIPVEVGHVVYIPSGLLHGFTARSDNFSFLSIQQPPIAEDYIFASEDKIPVDPR
jgi:mannose-6-phosphate isomerase-like protein (cupin superfamily)